MVTIFLVAQLGAAVIAAAGDSAYASTALRAFVASAAAANALPPAELQGYTSHIETEAALILRDTLGREHTGEVEQLASDAVWSRDGRYHLHVVGYRAQTVGVPYSTLSLVRAWTVPSLYGDRLSLGAYFVESRRGSDTLRAVHPFAADRDRYYRFAGGDTVAVLHTGAQDIPIVRLRVHPDFHGPTRLGAFDGEIDVDATRHQIVRMRGQFVVLGGQSTASQRIATRAFGVVAVAYIEFVNALVEGKYWLPAFQRTEFQASFPLLTQARPVFRLVSTIHIGVVQSTLAANDSSAPAGPTRVRLTWAPGDSVSRFGDWMRPIGEQSGSVHSDDFADMAPDEWKSSGPPRVSLFPNNTARIFRFNRVEGAYLGLAPTVDFRSLFPGLSVGVYGGWAFSEQTARGGAFASYHVGQSIYGARAERALASTNDFTIPLTDDPGFAALIGSVDDDDYVDRRTAMVSATRIFRSVDAGLLTTQFGVGGDRPERARLEHGLLSTAAFRANRGARSGDYVIGMADLELHPNVTGDFVQPGVGAHAHYEAAGGDLAWQRIELRLSARRYWGPVSFAAHADGGMLLGQNPPPQQLFELGGSELLPGYAYKQFVGDRAALLRSFVSYRFGVLQKPMRFIRNYYLPGLSPGVAASIQGGWTGISSTSAAQPVRELGVSNGEPVSTASNGVRATAGGGLTFFSDLLHVGAARPIDQPASWRFVIGFGASF
ncbi:MAG TPA: hypothetical protein VH277_14415 [Gemmatimonadaceae bacterium]|jgi:hypothetical protein|nr:hypothetical protein [Gemmatimonadaceae bacterium]